MILRLDLLILSSLLCPPVLTADTRSGESGRPRGVGPEFAKFYKSPDSTFTCISNPSKSIPFSQVNDDFCDCPDGSDEPGTAACSYLSPFSPPQPQLNADGLPIPENTTLALPGFYCKNKGHVPSYVPFENVNDGKCDYDLCCDGSEEYAGVGGVKCEDRCKDIGKEWRKNEEVRLKALRGATKRRKDLLTEAEKLRKETEIKIQDLEIKVKGFEVKVEDAKAALLEVERKEKLRVVKSGTGGQGQTGILLGLAKGRVEELRTSLKKTRTQRDAMLGRVAELEEALSKLKSEHNPNFNDEGVKTAVRTWEDYAARETDDSWSEGDDRDLDAILKDDGAESGINWSEFENNSTHDASDDVAALYQFSSYLPATLQDWLSAQVSTLRSLLVEAGVLPPSASTSDSPSDISSSPAVVSARKHLTDTERDQSTSQSDLTRALDDLKRDHGPQDVFRALKSTCITRDSGEYTYELCFMASTKQKPKKGGSDTNMGNFVGFDTEEVDDGDGHSPEGKSLGTGTRVVMKYEGGQHCWNGPNRATRVVLACSEKDEIWRVSESEKCIYRMEVGTAAVCDAVINGSGASNTGTGKEIGKDEL